MERVEKIITELKKKPEHERRRILHFVMFFVIVILVVVFIFSLRQNFTGKKEISRSLKPFSFLKDNLVKTVNGVSNSVKSFKGSTQ